jgi:(p)ppGpp synthase/HD superfamily hydrolase
VSHLLAVASLVLEDGGSEDEVIAGLLHDVVEDRAVSITEIADRYGNEVARIVDACSDASGGPDEEKPAWLKRKQDHLAHLCEGGVDVPVLRVTAADKLHNCRDLVTDVYVEGPSTLGRFKGGVQGTCWYYGQMTLLLEERLPDSRLTGELGRQARVLHELVGLEFPAATPPG